MMFATPSLLLAALLAAQVTTQPATRDGGRPAPEVTQTPAGDPPADAPASAPATIRLATWNIENWRDHFQFAKMKGEPRPDDAEHDQLRFTERFQNDEDNWEIAQVLLDPAFSPDVLVFQEGPVQADLEAFRDEWLGDAYETAIVFDSNTTRDQTIGLLMKPGFKIVERADQYYLQPDAEDVNPRGDRLFARGPAFALVEAAGRVSVLGRHDAPEEQERQQPGGHALAQRRGRRDAGDCAGPARPRSRRRAPFGRHERRAGPSGVRGRGGRRRDRQPRRPRPKLACCWRPRTSPSRGPSATRATGGRGIGALSTTWSSPSRRPTR